MVTALLLVVITGRKDAVSETGFGDSLTAGCNYRQKGRSE